MKRCIKIFTVLCVFSAIISLAEGGGSAFDRLDRFALDPLNATYLIENKAVDLIDGRCEVPAAPGSEMKTKTAVLDQPVYGDMVGDGDDDAALLITHDPGGSGTFYYVAAAINVNGRYEGTNAVLLGDRVAPMDIAIRNGAIVVSYADRLAEESRSAKPSVNKTSVLILKSNKLFKITPFGERGNIVEGWVTIGHEVRSFEPCILNEELWLMGRSPAINKIKAAYRRVMTHEKVGRSVFMVLAGKRVEAPADGFGADYEAAFLSTHLVWVAPGANCTNEALDIESPIRFRQKVTFDISKLDKDGLNGPPGGKRALAYEFCIPNTARNKSEVEQIDPTITFFAESPGRIGCVKYECLCIGTSDQKDFRRVLQRLAELTYVRRIDEIFFE